MSDHLQPPQEEVTHVSNGGNTAGDMQCNGSTITPACFLPAPRFRMGEIACTFFSGVAKVLLNMDKVLGSCQS